MSALAVPSTSDTVKSAAAPSATVLRPATRTVICIVIAIVMVVPDTGAPDAVPVTVMVSAPSNSWSSSGLNVNALLPLAAPAGMVNVKSSTAT